MMASIGLVAQHYWKLPGFENLPSGFSILGTQEGLLGLFALFLVSGCLENTWREDPNGAKEPGNFGDPFGLQMYTQEMRMKELNNGRMAMISVLGIFAAEMVSGKDAIQQFGLQALGSGQLRSSGSSFTGKTSAQSAQSQLVTRRAFQPSQQIGASEPLGFFDPLEFTKVGDEQGFRKLRTSEIKHGRALLAQFDESHSLMNLEWKKCQHSLASDACISQTALFSDNIFFGDSSSVGIELQDVARNMKGQGLGCVSRSCNSVDVC